MSTYESPESASLSVAPVDRWLAPVTRFLHVEAASGVVLLACTAVALAIANSPFAGWFFRFWKTPVALSVGDVTLSGDLGHLIVNDGLMTIFFFVVGLEVKREIVHGEFRDPMKALLPVFAALGGVLVPAAIFLTLQWGEPGQRGWAIPMATDIAFVVGFLALFGKRVPFGLKILLLSLAIVDDLVAVLIIALVFTEAIAWSWLGWAAGTFGLVYAFHRIGVRSVGVYVVLGVFTWLAFLQSGVHPTVAGVLLGLLTPAHAWIGQRSFADVLKAAWQRAGRDVGDPHAASAEARRTQFAAREAVSPLQRLEDGLHPWVAFGVMPLFGFANAGVEFAGMTMASLAEPVNNIGKTSSWPWPLSEAIKRRIVDVYDADRMPLGGKARLKPLVSVKHRQSQPGDGVRVRNAQATGQDEQGKGEHKLLGWPAQGWVSFLLSRFPAMPFGPAIC